MSKKLILVLVVNVFFLHVNLARAEVIINEVMYAPVQSDSYNEWIELYNTDLSSSVDLTNLTLCGTADTDKIKSGYIKKGATSVSNDDGMMLQAGQYAIITDGGSGTEVYDNFSIPSNALSLHVDSSSMCGGLSNNGEEIKLLGLSPANSFDYTRYIDKANGDGNSLQKISGSWVGAIPTPGMPNQTSATTPPDSTPSPTGGGVLISPASNSVVVTETKNNKVTEEPKIKTKITAKNTGFVDSPISLQATTLGYSGEKLYSGKYFWNFGDGDSKEVQVNYSQPFSHTYFYPGEYTVSLDYYQNYYGEIPDASSQVIIKIVSNDIVISRVGDVKDFFIELKNNTDYNNDISNWVLVSDYKNFTIPKNTNLGPQKAVMLSPRITLFSIEDKNTLKLMNAQREVMFEYSPVIAPTVSSKNISVLDKKSKLVATNPVSFKVDVPKEALLASSIQSEVLDQKTESPYSPALFPVASFFFIGASAYAVYFIRKKKTVPETEDDFEILDE